jgi:hypothetical protein
MLLLLMRMLLVVMVVMMMMMMLLHTMRAVLGTAVLRTLSILKCNPCDYTSVCTTSPKRFYMLSYRRVATHMAATVTSVRI